MNKTKMFEFRYQLVLLFVIAAVYGTAAGLTAQTRPRIVKANQFPGADVGAKVNAADRDLGGAAGEILVSGGGRIANQIVVSSNHTLRVGPGTYVSTTSAAPILLKPGAKLIGSGWDAIILESTAQNQFTVISAYNNAQRNGSADS